MKITINGSPKELAELLDALGGMENAEENHELPPLLTELAKDEKTNDSTGLFGTQVQKNTSLEDAVDQKSEELARMVLESTRIFDD